MSVLQTAPFSILSIAIKILPGELHLLFCLKTLNIFLIYIMADTHMNQSLNIPRVK